ncbi:MAG: cysteine--tRNA ligase [Christensenellaceae bacterium]|jgi:cysteinyl-tRNA synthetase|nr:cysteine--tRNA ligase [Christensenellaceae bacterium]
MLKVYNTLTRTKQEFKSIIPELVCMYSCGPTVYSYAHIGNLRTYIFMDLVRRLLKFEGFKIKGVMNITDVGHLMADADSGEDKMDSAARELNKTPIEIAEMYTDAFYIDLEKLNIEKPEIIVKATDHVNEMISYVEKLIQNGYAYEISDGIYFDRSKFPKYGILSGAKLDDQIAGIRVEVNNEKRHPADFALWKKAEPLHIMRWDSPWGEGYPGWHIECSVMSQKYLGETFDIHTGGVDHIPIHHENEIAQNEAISKKQSVNYWMHGEFMLVDGGKMSKSLKNTYTISDLEERGYSALDFRYFCLNAHYRSKLNFTFVGMDAAKKTRENLGQQLAKHKESTIETDKEILNNYRKSFKEAIEDDLNVPLALGILFTILKEPKSRCIYDLAIEFDAIFGLALDNVPDLTQKKSEDTIPIEILELANKRSFAKRNKDYVLADKIRSEISKNGYLIIDTKDGFTISKEGEKE